jgi:hypothetical protein
VTAQRRFCFTSLLVLHFISVQGVTAIRPDDLDFPSTMTDINHDTWMLSGSAVMQDGITLRNGYGCDLDTLTSGTRIGKSLALSDAFDKR